MVVKRAPKKKPTRKVTDQFKRDDLVWAKIRYFQPWPAKVIDPPSGSSKKNCYFVFFYGSDDFGWIKRNDICSYILYYKENFRRRVRNSSYSKGVKKIGEIYHEEYQLHSPSYKKMKAEEEENDARERALEAEVEKNEPECALEPNYDYDLDLAARNKNRTKEEIEERRKKIQERLKVRLFPVKGGKKSVKNRKNKKGKKSAVKNKAGNKASKKSTVRNKASKKSTVRNKASKKSTVRNKAGNKALKEGASSTTSSSSSCIITVHYQDYRKIIPNEVRVHLQRCDEGLPSLTSGLEEQNVMEPHQEDPPVLLPEI